MERNGHNVQDDNEQHQDDNDNEHIQWNAKMKKEEAYCNKLMILALHEHFWPKQPKFSIFVISGAFLT